MRFTILLSLSCALPTVPMCAIAFHLVFKPTYLQQFFLFISTLMSRQHAKLTDPIIHLAGFGSVLSAAQPPAESQPIARAQQQPKTGLTAMRQNQLDPEKIIDGHLLSIDDLQDHR
ncbi:hypothetical protein DPEC_G00308600 [Dallia pectoralis]|uniref:Uncharacterized protein n=1 Tax=Dallia pectoralis TaxID=75939 RepID=A0ACC2FER0_DALPE|nr:hypothetical protein DPEC_G00308600 [Dallia pectoralis]